MKEPNFLIFQQIPATDTWYRQLGSFGTYKAAEDWLKSLGAEYIDLDSIPDEIVYCISRHGNYRIVNEHDPNVVIKKDHIFGDVLVSTKN